MKQADAAQSHQTRHARRGRVYPMINRIRRGTSVRSANRAGPEADTAAAGSRGDAARDITAAAPIRTAATTTETTIHTSRRRARSRAARSALRTLMYDNDWDRISHTQYPNILSWRQIDRLDSPSPLPEGTNSPFFPLYPD